MPFRWTLTDLATLEHEVLTNDPLGWEAGTYSIRRSEDYKGAFHQYTTNFKFHCNGGGKQFIDAVYEARDIDGRIDILIEYDCDGSGTYDTLFNGTLNLASYKTENDYTTVNIESTDLLTKLYSRDEVNVDMESAVSIGGQAITPLHTTQVALQPVVLDFKSEFLIYNGYVKEEQERYKSIDVHKSYFTHNTSLLRADWTETVPWSEFNTMGTDKDVTSFQRSQVQYVLKMNTPAITFPQTVKYTVDFKGTFEDTQLTDNATRKVLNYQLMLMYGIKEPYKQMNEIAIYWGAGNSRVGGYEASPFIDYFDTTTNPIYTGNIDLNPGDEVYLVWFLEYWPQANNTDVKVKWTYNESRFTLEGKTSYRSTKTKSVLVHDAFMQVVDAIADSDSNFHSDYFGRTDSQKETYTQNGCGSLLALTNGLNIRELYNKPLYHNFKGLFNAIDCIYNIGLGYTDGKIRIEPLAFFFDNTTRIISLPFVNRYELKADNPKYINKIQIGYAKWQAEFNGGLYDPNAKHEYSTIISSAKTTFIKLCEYITSSFSIEFTRRKNVNIAPTEDWRYDNDNFIIAVKAGIQANATFEAFGNMIILEASITAAPYDIITITGSAQNSGTFTVMNVLAAGAITYIYTFETLTDSGGAELITLSNTSRNIYAPERANDAFNSVSNMEGHDSAINLRLTPKRMLLAHLNVITAGLQKIKGFVKFVKGEGNTALITAKKDIGCPEDFDGQPLGEADSIEWSDDRARNIHPLWFPEVYSFEYPLTYQQFKTIKANPYGYIEFYRFENDKKAGYILNMEYQLKTGMTKFELLRIFAPEAVGDENGNYVGETINDELIMIRG
jgi:hypothetical protein